MKYFFWIAFAVFLAASIPHVAYFFASFEPSQGPEGVWWWAVSYAIAISIDVTVYLLSWTAFQRYRRYRTPRAVWQHWLLIVMCTIFSWGVNWAYAKQFHSATMLSSAESVAPWLTNVFPFMASAFPLLGIVYTMMAETITETAAEEKLQRDQQLTALAELAKQTSLPVATLRRALISGTSTSLNNFIAGLQRTPNEAGGRAAVTGGGAEQSEAGRPITAQVVAIGQEEVQSSGEVVARPSATVSPVVPTSSGNEGNPDKLQMTLEALKKNPDITDEALAAYLSLKRPASARFWRLKAIEILRSNGGGELQGAKGPGQPITDTLAAWATPERVNGNGKR